MKPHIPLIFCMFWSSMCLSAAAADDSCRDILVYAARDENVADYDLQSADDAYNEYCQNDQVKEGADASLKAQAIVEELPVGVNFAQGSSSNKVSQFCKKYRQARFKRVGSHTASSLINSTSVSSWQKCVELQSEGVAFKPHILDTQFDIEVRRTSGAPVRVQGAFFDSSLLSCTLPGLPPNGTPVTVDAGTTRSIEDADILTMTCIRSPQLKGETVEFPKVDFSISTNRGVFSMPVPAAARMPMQWSKDYEKRLSAINDELQGKIDRLDSEMKGQVFDLKDGLSFWGDGQVDKPDQMLGLDNQHHICQEGYYVTGVLTQRTGAGLNAIQILCNKLAVQN